MEKEPTDATHTPLELLNAAESYHRGLRNVELQQIRGRSGYVAVDGARWRFINDHGEPCAHDERPPMASRDIATRIYLEARDARRRPAGGDTRFQAVFFVAQPSGEPRAHRVRFEVATSESLTAVDVESATAQAHVLSIGQLLAHIGELHRSIETLPRAFAEAISTMQRSIQDTATMQQEAILKPVIDLLPRVLQLRIDAADELALAREAHAASKGNTAEAWRASARELVGLARSPVGIAAAAKLMGIAPEQAAAMFGAFQPAAPPDSTSSSVRELLRALDKSLDASQRAALLGRLGAPVLLVLKRASEATSDADCVTALREFFGALADEHWQALADVLSRDQGVLVERIMALSQTAEH